MAIVTETGTTRPTSVSVAAEAVAVTVNSDGSFGSVRQQVRGVVEMHQAQQALDDREAGVGGGRTDRGEHRGPAAADQGIGHDGERRRQRCTECRGDAGVVGDPLGIPRDGDGGGVAVTSDGGSASGPSMPAAIASTTRMAAAASSVDTIGVPPSTVRRRAG